MYRTVCLTFLLLASFIPLKQKLSAQTLFENRFPGFYEINPVISSLFPTSGGGYGFTHNFYISPTSVEGCGLILRDKLDQYHFNVGRSSNASLPNNYHGYKYFDGEEISDTLFLSAGAYLPGAVAQSNLPAMPYLTTFDLGNSLNIEESWYNFGATGRNAEIRFIFKRPAGRHTIVGELRPDSNYQNRGAYFAQIGPGPFYAVTWAKYFTHPLSPRLLDADQLENGNLAIGFSLDTLGSYLLVIDSLGNKVWSRRLPNFHNLALAASVDDGLYISGSDSNASVIARLDSTGNLVWANNYGDVNTSAFSDLEQSTDGSLVACGQQGPQMRSLLKVNPSGGVEWGRLYPGGIAPTGGPWMGRVAQKVSSTLDGGYLLGCESNYVDLVWFQPTKIMEIIRTDSLGHSCIDSSFSYASAPVPLSLQIFADTVRNDSVFQTVTATQPNWSAYLWQAPNHTSVCNTATCNLQVTADVLRDTVCVGDTLRFFRSSPADSNVIYYWSGTPYINYTYGPYAAGDSFLVEAFQPGNFQYYLIAEDTVNSCISYDSVKAFAQTAPSVVLGADYQICAPGMETLSGPAGLSSYLWSTGGTAATDSFAAPGLAWLEVNTSGGCTARDSIWVSLDTLRPHIEPDSIFCPGESVQLYAGPGGTSYRWGHGGFQGPWALGVAGGTYSVEMTTPVGCVFSDTLTIDTFSVQAPVLGDTSICTGDSLQITATGGFLHFLWSNGDTTASTSFVNGGSLWLQVQDSNGCTSADTFALNFRPLPSINLGPDLSICPGDSAQLGPVPGFAQYQWSTGSQQSTISVNQPGSYWLQVTDNFGCTGRDSLNLAIWNVQNLSIGDSSFCSGDSILIFPLGVFQSYLWSNGSTSGFLPVDSGGTYSLQATDINGCVATDTFTVDEFPLPQPYLGPDTMLCDGESLLLDPGNGFASYHWSDNSQDSTLMAQAGSQYAVTVSNAQGCQGSDTLNVGLAPDPTANFAYSVNGLQVQFSNLSSGGASFLWVFGDGDSSSIGSPTHLYPAGSFSACLIVYSAQGCEDSLCQALVLTDRVAPADENLILYPQPAQGRVSLQSTGAPIEEWALYDLKGRLLRQQKDIFRETCSFSVADLPAAQYLIKVKRKGEWLIRRLTVLPE